jgi:putative ABC transport system substrate-binding protein
VRRRNFIGQAAVAAIGCPFTASAQTKATPVIGLLASSAASSSDTMRDKLKAGLREAGYADGENVSIEYRFAEGRYDRLPELAADLVASNVRAIGAFSGPAALAAKRATSTVPIVFAIGADAVALGLVTSLAHPGGNVTGAMFLTVELMAKRFEILADLVPQARLFGLIVNSANAANANRIAGDVGAAAQAKGIALEVLRAGSADELDAAFARLGQLKPDGLVMSDDPFLNGRREQVIRLASNHGIPTIYPYREFVVDAGFVSYGSSVVNAAGLMGSYLGRILAGEQPADLPVQQSAKFDFAINLKTASAWHRRTALHPRPRRRSDRVGRLRAAAGECRGIFTPGGHSIRIGR